MNKIFEWWNRKRTNEAVGFVLGSIGTALAAISVVLYVRPRLWVWDCYHLQAFQLGILCLWIIAPPCWFALESMALLKDEVPAVQENARRTQEIVSKVWVGVSAMLGVLASALLKDLCTRMP
jgi:hypothetical protein